MIKEVVGFAFCVERMEGFLRKIDWCSNTYEEENEKRKLKEMMRYGAYWDFNKKKLLFGGSNFFAKGDFFYDDISYWDLVDYIEKNNNVKLIEYVQRNCRGEIYHRLLFKQNDYIFSCHFNGFNPIWYTQWLGNFLIVKKVNIVNKYCKRNRIIPYILKL